MLGSDVNLIHRLTKNSITEELGLRAYALYTQAAVDALEISQLAAKMAPHQEAYEHLGEVATYVQDMHAVWTEREAKNPILVPPDETLFLIEHELPYEPFQVWDFMTKPQYRTLVYSADQQTLSDVEDGRIGVGASYHCAHGDANFMHLILDWQPFDHYTYDEYWASTDTVVMVTIKLTPTDEGTRVGVSYGMARGQDPEMVAAANEAARTEVYNTIQQAMQIIDELVGEELDAGRLVSVERATIPAVEIDKAVAASLPG